MIKENNYEEAYAEVIEVLNYIPMNEYKKIPKKYITFMEENCSESSSFIYNIALPFDKQDISDTAKNILGMIFRLFIIGESQKEKLNKIDKDTKKQKDLENYIKYNKENLFKNRNNSKDNGRIIDNTLEQEVALVKYKEPLLRKIWNKILSIFKI